MPADDPVCDNEGGLVDSMFFSALIAPFAPYSLSGILWDQAERDVHCFAPATNKIAEYAAWQRALAESWRAAFKSRPQMTRTSSRICAACVWHNRASSHSVRFSITN